jgi:hypothetical protein
MAGRCGGVGSLGQHCDEPAGRSFYQATAARLSPHLDGTRAPADVSATRHSVGDYVSQAGGGYRCYPPWQDEQPPSASQ